MFKLILRSRFKLSRVCCVQPFNTSFQIRACQDSRTYRIAIQLYFNCLSTTFTFHHRFLPQTHYPSGQTWANIKRGSEPQWANPLQVIFHYVIFTSIMVFILQIIMDTVLPQSLFFCKKKESRYIQQPLWHYGCGMESLMKGFPSLH